MNGLLTALLGGASGVGQAIQYQNELGLKRNALDLEKAKMLADLAMQGMYQVPGNTPTSAPTMPTQPSGPIAAAPSTAPNGPPQGVLTGLMRNKDGFKFSQAAAAPPPQSQPAGGGDDILSQIGSAMPQQSLSLPGMGSFQYNPLNSPAMLRGLITEAYKRKLETQGAVDVANQTGVTAEHAANTRLANRHAGELLPGDPGYIDYMSKLEGSKALATLPVKIREMVAQGQISLSNGIALANNEGKIRLGLQQNQQTFEGGQQEKRQQFDAAQQERGKTADFLNRSYEINQERRGQGIYGRMFAPEPATVAPSSVKPDLATRVKELQTFGLSKEAARVQLIHEGYDLSGGKQP